MLKRLAVGLVVAFLSVLGFVPMASAAHADAAPAGTWWQPGAQPYDWQWYLAGVLDTSSSTDMGIGDETYAGAPAADPTVYDIDGIENSASTVAALHAYGDHVICYIEVGTAGDYYSAAEEGNPTTYYAQFQAAGVLGDKLSGYPEYFLNINSPATVSIVEAMISQQCAAKGFDAVETDLDETFNSNEGATGFTITEADEEAYMTTLADYMHGLGLGWVLKDCDDVGDASYCDAMEPLADAVLSEQCQQYGTCSYLDAFTAAGKAVFDAEYQGPASSFCPTANSENFNAVLFDADLDGATRVPCRSGDANDSSTSSPPTTAAAVGGVTTTTQPTGGQDPWPPHSPTTAAVVGGVTTTTQPTGGQVPESPAVPLLPVAAAGLAGGAVLVYRSRRLRTSHH